MARSLFFSLKMCFKYNTRSYRLTFNHNSELAVRAKWIPIPWEEWRNRASVWLSRTCSGRFSACGDLFPKSPSTWLRQNKWIQNFWVLVLIVQLPNVDKYLDKLDKTLDKSLNVLKKFLRLKEVLRCHNSLTLSFSWDR